MSSPSFTLVPLLLHSEAVPEAARDALRSAISAPPEQRDSELLVAARVLRDETTLDCADARILVGLSECGSCA
jgi:hypothetical protein